MQCFVYKSIKKTDTYIYVERKGDFSRIPDKLIILLGTLEFVMNIELSEKRKLANADLEDVIQMLSSQGYYLQLPPMDYIKAQ